MALAEQLGNFTMLVGGPEYVHCLLVSLQASDDRFCKHMLQGDAFPIILNLSDLCNDISLVLASLCKSQFITHTVFS